MYKIQKKKKEVTYGSLSAFAVFIHKGKLCMKYDIVGGSSICVLTRNPDSDLTPSLGKDDLVRPVKILEVLVEEI